MEVETSRQLLIHQFDINPQTEYHCSVDIKSRGFTEAMKLVMTTGIDPSSIDKLKQMLPSCLTDTNTKGWTLLHLASANSAHTSTLSTVQLLLDHSIDINAQNEAKYTALILALLYSEVTSSLETVNLLINFGADINMQNINGQNALHLIINYLRHATVDNYKTTLDIIQRIMINTTDINAIDKDNWNALHYATSWSDKPGAYDIVKLLIEHNIDINLQNQYGKTALHNAIYYGEPLIAKLLIDSNIDVNIVTKQNYNALHYVTNNFDMTTFDLLLNTNIEINKQNNEGETVLHCLIEKSNIDAANKIIAYYGADPNIQNNKGNTALHHVAHFCKDNVSTQIASTLINAGVNIDALNNNGKTALDLAIGKKNISLIKLFIANGTKINGTLHTYFEYAEIIELLLDEGFDINTLDQNNNTVLHKACQFSIETTQLLLNRNIDINARNNKGQTALHIACEKKNIDIVKLLIDYNADIDALTNEGYTPLYIAHKYMKSSGSVEIFDFLVKVGANIGLILERDQSDLMKYLIRQRRSNIKCAKN
jgi:serine/threonine-protein phosphatase 6 regulatory ankyrin repeat subunit A/serine/threonine-protein phosphatase 6 regulatory ankyrin repeat subunit B